MSDVNSYFLLLSSCSAPAASPTRKVSGCVCSGPGFSEGPGPRQVLAVKFPVLEPGGMASEVAFGRDVQGFSGAVFTSRVPGQS